LYFLAANLFNPEFINTFLEGTSKLKGPYGGRLLVPNLLTIPRYPVVMNVLAYKHGIIEKIEFAF
jgi:hypothetical protein